MKWMASLLGMVLLLSSCSEEEWNPTEESQQTKTIKWEVFHEFEPGETVYNSKYQTMQNGCSTTPK